MPNLRPTVWGTQTALVVGRTDADLHTDRDGRVRVQFHWQRGRRSSHRLTAERGDNAPASAASGTWVRVGQSLAGANHGAVFTPRIGQEVVVGFAGADIDRPVVAYDGRRWPDAPGSQMGSGAAHASGNAPAWFAGQQAAGDHEGHQHPAAMLGHKSQERGSSDAGTGGYNQLVFDDSVEGNRIELSTTTQATRLQIGALLHQQDNPRLAPQGAWAGPDDPCPRLASSRLGHAAHRARTAARARVAAASSWKRAMPGPCCSGPRPCPRPGRVGAGAQRQARARADSRRDQARLDAPAVAERTRPAYPDRQPEGDGFDGDDGTRGGDGKEVAIEGGYGTVSAWGRPDLVLAAPAGIGFFTPASAILSASTHVTWTAGQDLHSIAQGHHASVARHGVVLYTYGMATNSRKPNQELGVKVHTASGTVVASSNTGATRPTARGAIDVTSSKTQVLVASPTQILLTAAGAAIQIDACNITIKAPGEVKFKAGLKVFTDGAKADEQPRIAKPAPFKGCAQTMNSAASAQASLVDLGRVCDWATIPSEPELSAATCTICR